MSGTQTYEERYKYWYDFGGYADMEYDFKLQYGVLSRLLCGKLQYQQLILNHTCLNMFTDIDLRAIYKIITEYVEKYGIEKLNTEEQKRIDSQIERLKVAGAKTRFVKK